jgi:FAD/FMN-containing dehydrogenase
MRLSTLNDLLAPHDLCLPIDLAADPSLGGMVATNTGGARMLHDGDVRRRVLGLEVVLADVVDGDATTPTVLDDLTRLRKDNTGPRPSSVMVGSAGAFGVVTRVAIELSRRPREQACALLAPTDAAGAIAALRVFEGALGSLLSAYEVMSAAAIEMAVATVPGVRAPWRATRPSADGTVPEVTVLVEAAGPSHVEDALAAAVADASGSGAVRDAVLVPFEDAWGLRHAMSEGLARTGTVVGFDVSVPRSELVSFRLDVVRRVAEALPRAVVADFGHWADGGTHCNLVFPDPPPSPTERELARSIVFSTAVHDHDGSFSAEHGIGPHNADWWLAVTPPADRALVRTLRDTCDPHRVLGHPALPF